MALGSSNPTADIKKLAGFDINTNLGSANNGTQRVVLASNQSIIPVNLDQLAGQNIAIGTGVRTAGTQRVTIATDDIVPVSQIGIWNVELNAGTNGIGKLTANSGVTIGAVELAASQTLATVTTVGSVTSITNALPAGANAIGKLAANSGVTIGAVEIAASQSIAVTQTTAANLNATVTGTVELGATSLAALENISVTVPGTVDLGTVSLTALETITVTSGTPGNFVSKVYGAVTTAAPSYINSTDNALSLTTSGSLRVDLMSSLPAGTNGIGKLTANSGVTIGAVELAASQTLATVTNLSQLGGQNIAMGTGARTAGTLRVTVATDDILPASQSGTWNVGLNAGSNAIGSITNTSFAVTQATPSNLNATVSIAASQTLATVTTVGAVTSITNALPAGTNTIGKVEPVSPSTGPNSNATTTGFANSLQIKASAGTLFMLSGYNSKTSNQFIQIHNATSLIGGAAPVITFVVAPTSNFSFDFGVYGRYFSTGIYVANSTMAATYTASASDCWFDAQYK